MYYLKKKSKVICMLVNILGWMKSEERVRRELTIFEHCSGLQSVQEHELFYSIYHVQCYYTWVLLVPLHRRILEGRGHTPTCEDGNSSFPTSSATDLANGRD